jgi:glucose/galactose transporter
MKKQPSYHFSLFVIGILFFVFGFITWVNSQLIPFLKQTCQLQTDTQAYWVTFAFYISYFVMSIPSSYILHKTGFVKGMALGLITMAAGALLFIPAATMHCYGLFLTALFIQGTGLALLQTAANPYAVILGNMESAAKRISIMGVCNKTAGMAGIFIFGSILFANMENISAQLKILTGQAYNDQLTDLINRLIPLYIVIAVVLIVLAGLIVVSRLPEMERPSSILHEKKINIFSFKHLWLGVAAIFAYVGAEVIAIDTLTFYGEFHGIAESQAKNFSIYSLIALTVGYIAGMAVVPKYVSQRSALAISAVLALIMAFVAVFTPASLSIAMIIGLSFAHAMMWPCIFPLSLVGLGKYTELGSALLIMAVAGGAVLPLGYAVLSDWLQNRQWAYLILLPLHLYILFFSLQVQKRRRNETARKKERWALK